MRNLIMCVVGTAFLSLSIGCDSQKVPDHFTLNGTITGNTTGKKVYLRLAENRKVNLDSTVIKDGRFVFTDTTLTPRLYEIVIKKSDTAADPHRPSYQPVIPVFVQNAVIDIAAELDSIPTEDHLYYGDPYSYENVSIKGSDVNDIYLEFVSGYNTLAKKRTEAFFKYIDYLNPGEGKQKGPVSEGIALVTKIDESAATRDAYVKEFVKKNHDNVVGAYVAGQKLSAFSVNDIDSILGSLSPEVMATDAGKQLTKKAIEVKKTATGAPFADFAFNDNKGNPVKFSEYLGKGKYVLIDFWASWCGPCRADIPHLKDVYKLYHPAGFEVISVSMDDDKAKWLKAIDEEQMAWLQVSDLKAFSGQLSKLYNFNGIPTCVLVDPEGKIVTRNMRGSWMDKKLIELYGNKFGDKF